MRRPVCDLTLDELREHYGYAVIGQNQTIPHACPYWRMSSAGRGQSRGLRQYSSIARYPRPAKS